MTKSDIWIWNTLDKHLFYLSDHHKYLLYRAAKYFQYKTKGNTIEWCLGIACRLLNKRYNNQTRIDKKFITWLLT